MCQCEHVAERLVEGHEDARFFIEHRASAKAAGRLPTRGSQSTQFLPMTCWEKFSQERDKPDSNELPTSA
jgi:hypothetical protein